MYWLDTTILVILGAGAIFGALAGLLMQLARLVGFLIALFAAIYFNEGAATLLQDRVMQEAEPWLTYLVAYVLVFLAVYLTIYLLTLALERGLKAVRLQVLNRILGALLGAGKLALLLGGIFLGVAQYPSDSTRDMLRKSTLAPLLADGTENLVSSLAAECGADLDDPGSSLRQAVERPAPEAAAR
jgi:membrane protein required for colicin V production